jgi:tRNA threonylcarbamoyladenosine modification (KEOPS) complex Cgi121 subunit
MPAEEEHDEIRIVIQTMREIRNAIILVGLATGENSVARSEAKSALEVWAREQGLLKR